MWQVLMSCMFALLASACTTYSRLPLPERADLASSVPTSDPTPLDMNAVATLAVLYSPDLRAARAKANLSEAQAFAAGLLPDPQITASVDGVTDRGLGFINAYGRGLTLDVQALLGHSAKKGAARAQREQARLDMLWQEWQTVALARTLFVQQSLAVDRQQFLAEAEQNYSAQALRSERALAAGDTTLDLAGVDLALWSDVGIQLGVARRSALQTEQSLHALLGLAPEVSVPLQSLGTPPLPEPATIEAALAKLPLSRPDLAALQAGYRSQEALLRKAVLAQFPMVSLSFNQARDTSNVHTNGLGVTLSLPLFDHGRGEIAIQRATRAQLRAEFQVRLDQTRGTVWRLSAELRELQDELRQVDQRLPKLAATVTAARRSFEGADLAASTYYTLYSAWLTARAAKLDLTQALWNDAIALSTELGIPL